MGEAAGAPFTRCRAEADGVFDTTGGVHWEACLLRNREKPMSGLLPPTSYADVNAVLAHFLTQIRAVLGDRFRGMYLDDSLALGDFNLQTSDIDFVVITDAAVSDDHFTALRALHGVVSPNRRIFCRPRSRSATMAARLASFPSL